MDEQNPRLTAEDVSGRGDDRTTGYDRDLRNSPSGPGSEVWGAARLRADRNTATSDASSADRTRELRSEIAQTRDDLSETVNAIQDRLRPSTMAAEAADSVKRAALSTAREVGDSEPVLYARANPIPTAMVAIGVAGAAWLAMAGRDAQSRGGDSAPRDRARGWYTPGTASEYNPDLSNTYASIGGQSAQRSERRDRWSRQESGVSDRLMRSLPDRRTLRGAWEQSPMLIGAVAALVGAVVGLSVPETDREHQLMGETRDALVDRVQETVRDKVGQVQEVASDAVHKVQHIAVAEPGSAESDRSS